MNDGVNAGDVSVEDSGLLLVYLQILLSCSPCLSHSAPKINERLATTPRLCNKIADGIKLGVPTEIIVLSRFSPLESATVVRI